MANDEDKGKINAEAGGDFTVGGDIVSGGKVTTTTTTTTTHISEGGPVARYAVIGMAVIAVVAVIGILIAVLRPWQSATPTLAPTPAFTIVSTPPTTGPTSASVATNTTVPTPVEATATSSPTPVPPTPTPLLYFRSGCVVAESWIAFPRASNLGGCLSLSDFGFNAQDNVLSIDGRQSTSSNSDEKQQGIYLPLAGDADIQFALEVMPPFWSVNDRSNLSFGILNITDGFSYVNGSVYLCYFAAQQKNASDVPIRVNPGNSLCIVSPPSGARVAAFSQSPRIHFSLKAGELIISVDNIAVCCERRLGFARPAFYIGYDLHGESDLSAMISDFTVQTK